MKNDLTLPQAILLLTLKDETGSKTGTFYSQALAGAALTELVLRGAIRLTDEKKPKVLAVNTAYTQDVFLDECLQKIAEAKSPKPINTWVSKLAQTKSIVEKVAKPLCDKGILSQEKSKILGLFPVTKWPEVNPRPERALKTQMSAAMFASGEGAFVDERLTTLIALSKHAGLLSHNFDKVDLRTNKARIEQIAKGDMIAGDATAAVIKAIQTAIIVVAVMPAVM